MTQTPDLPFWRLDGFIDDAGNALQPKTEWKLGGIYQHLEHRDGRPPLYGGFDEYTADFFQLVWTEVPDPRLAAAEAARVRTAPPGW